MMTQPGPGEPLDATVPSRPDQTQQPMAPYSSAPQALYSSAPQALYDAPRPQFVYMVTPPKNDLAVWSLATGILSWVFCPLALGIAAIVTGSASRRAVQEGQANNPGMATAGLVLGWVNVGLAGVIFVGWILLLVAGFAGVALAVSS